MPQFVFWKKKPAKNISKSAENNEESTLHSQIVFKSLSGESVSFKQFLDVAKKDKTIDQKEVSKYENLPKDMAAVHNQSVKLFIASKSLSDKANEMFGSVKPN